MPSKNKAILAAKRKRNRKRRAKEGKRQRTLSNVPDKLWPAIKAMALEMISDSKGGRDE